MHLSSQANPSKLLTNLTADVDSIKLFYFAGHSIHYFFPLYYYGCQHLTLITINWKLALCVISHYTHYRYYIFCSAAKSAGIVYTKQGSN